MKQFSLLDEIGGIPLIRTPDHETSKIAADKVRRSLSELQSSVLSHIALMQPVTALELEELEVFADLAPSTIRKRVSELARKGEIIGCGKQSYRSTRTNRTSDGIAWKPMFGASK